MSVDERGGGLRRESGRESRRLVVVWTGTIRGIIQ